MYVGLWSPDHHVPGGLVFVIMLDKTSQNIYIVIMAQVSIRIDDTIKDAADSLFSELGLTLSAAFNIFLRQSIRQQGIPFAITIDTDPFYNPANMKWIEQSIQQMKDGQIITKTFEELQQMAAE
jgi:DNA-damage-inducible protein J